MIAATATEDVMTRPATGRPSPILFHSLTLTTPERHAGRTSATFLTSVALHAALVAAIVILPLLSYDSLPPEQAQQALKAFFVQPPEVAAPPPPPPPPPPAAARALRRAPPVAQPSQPARFVAPLEVPEELPPPEETLDLGGVEGGVPGGVEGGVPGGVVGGVVGGLPQAPPPLPAPVRVGGGIKPPAKLKHVDPVYPELARVARVQGVVIVECLISPQGKVTEVKVLRGVPLLDQAAVDAVRQWVYTPTLLDSVPVPVIMTVTVNFNLQVEL